uniref:Uncharacterized protein n=1 Tax=Ditylenchus dipsaci TaxID=166011 RepID=A0A915DGM0_9BILA
MVGDFIMKVFECVCEIHYLGIKLSDKCTNKAPKANPTATGIKAKLPIVTSDISMAGASRDQKEAAVMTPPANPRLTSKWEKVKKSKVPKVISLTQNFLLLDGNTKTRAAPRAVTPH